jgi:gliding motility-associated-like protein
MYLCNRFLLALLLGGLSFSGYSRCVPVINLGNTVSFCQGNALVLNAFYPNSTYLWSNSSTNPTLTVTTSGTYWVKVSNQCGYTIDTVQVFTDQPLSLNWPATRTLCGNSTTLTAPNSPSYHYQWSTGDTTSSLQVSTPGSYWVRVTNACGTFGDTVQVLPGTGTAGVNLGPDLFPCTTNPVSISVPASISGNFLWNNGSRNRSISVSQTGQYWVKVTNSCGIFYDTIYLQHPSDLNLGIPDTVYFCPGAAITIKPTLIGSYLWSNNSTADSLIINQTGNYSVTLTHPCGTLQQNFIAILRSNVLVNLGPDTSLCAPGILDAKNNGASYVWNTGDRTQRLTVETTGWYSVFVSTPCGSGQDSVFITIKTVPGDSIADTVGYCQNNPAQLNAGNWGPNTQYVWSNGDTTKTSSFNITGAGSVLITNSCGPTNINFWVQPDMPLSSNFRDTSFCDSVPVYLIIPNWSVTDSAVWNNGSGGDSLYPKTSGQYWVEAFNTCDTIRDTAQITVYSMPLEFTDTLFFKCASKPLTLKAYAQENVNYLWGNNSTADSLVVQSAGTYTVKIYNRCDTIYDTLVVQEIPALDLNLPNDTTLCYGDTLTIFMPAQRGYTNYLNGQKLPVPFARLLLPGTYIFKTESPCGIEIDTLRLQFYQAPRPVIPTTYFCVGSSALLNAYQQQATAYQWSTGDTSNSITLNQAGWYYVDITSGCRTIRDSVLVVQQSPLPTIDLGPDTVFCAGTLLLNAGAYIGANYRWQDGTQSETYLVQTSGTYSVRVTNSCGIIRDTIVVLITGPPRAVLGTTVEYCATNQFYINAQNPGSQYLWNTGDTTQSVLVTNPGFYWVTITNNCGTLSDTVEVIPQYPYFDFGLPDDTLICEGSSYLIDPVAPKAQIRWFNGSQDSTFLVTATGYYSFSAENLCGVFRDTVYVLVENIPVFDLTDTAICYQNDSIALSGPSRMSSYQWSNGSQNRRTTYNQPGTYWLTVSNSCFAYTDTFELQSHFPIEFGLPTDTNICESEALLLDLSFIPHPITWDNGSQNKTRTINRGGIFWARSRNQCGVFYDSVQVFLQEDLSDTIIDKLLCNGDTLWVDLSAKPYQYTWPNGSAENIYPITSGGDVPVVIENLCGSSVRTYRVDISNCECPIFMAKAFTPNNDGLNDTYPVVHSCDFIDFEWTIFDRWGKRVYKGTNPDLPWDGKFGGDLLPNGVYIYHLRYKWRIYGIEQFRQEKGHFTLIR